MILDFGDTEFVNCSECECGPEEGLVVMFNADTHMGGHRYQAELICMECLVRAQVEESTHVLTTVKLR